MTIKTTKEKVLAMIQRQDNNITYDDLIYKLEFMKTVEQGIREADQGLGMDHDEFMAQLEAEDAAKNAQMDANGAGQSARNRGSHRANGAKKRPIVRETNQSGRKKP
jgi:hypothetical protein